MRPSKRSRRPHPASEAPSDRTRPRRLSATAPGSKMGYWDAGTTLAYVEAGCCTDFASTHRVEAGRGRSLGQAPELRAGRRYRPGTQILSPLGTTGYASS